MGALDASLGMRVQLALGRSWPLESHLPGAPASGLTEKKKIYIYIFAYKFALYMYIFTYIYIHILILDSGLPKFFPANSVCKAHKPQKFYLGYDGMTGDSLGWLGLCKPLIQCDFRKNIEKLPNCNLLPDLVQKAI